MYKNKTILALIPARGGSKKLPRKNIRPLLGKPLIVWTIEQALSSKYLDRVIVSTDDKEIANVALKYGIEIPFIRPDELATDNALAIDNYIYTIDRLNKEENANINEFVALNPTTPLRSPRDIDDAIKLFFQKNADSVISICESPQPPLWAKKINNSGKILNYFNSDVDNVNRQDLEQAYLPNGAIYVLKFSLLKNKYSFYSEKTYGYIMPAERSLDIDSSMDFEFAEFLMRKKKCVKGKNIL